MNRTKQQEQEEQPIEIQETCITMKIVGRN